MRLFSLLVVTLVTSCLSQMNPMQMCQSTSTPGITLTYTPFMAPQIGPTSTVYGAILTKTFFIIDCRYATVTNVDANPAPRGPFTAKTTQPTLTITRVACMPETTAITRRELRGDTKVMVAAPRSVDVSQPSPTNSQSSFHNLRRSIHHFKQQDLHRRSAQDMAEAVAQKIDPSNDLLPQKAYTLITQVDSALFAINLINSGFNLTYTCMELRELGVQLSLTAASLNPKQIADICCFASVYGFSLNTTNFELLSKLEAIIYAIQVGSDFTTDTTRLCNEIDVSFGPYLRIDSNEVTNYICGKNQTSSLSSSSSSVEQPTSEGTVTPPLITGTVGTASIGNVPTGGVGPYANSTMSMDTAAASGIYGTGFPGTSDSLSVEFPNATYSVNATHITHMPTTPLHYPGWTTSQTSSADLNQR